MRSVAGWTLGRGSDATTLIVLTESQDCAWFPKFRCRWYTSAEWLVPHLAFPTVHNKHIQREFVQSVEGMRLADIQVQIALHAHVPSSHRQPE